MRQNPRKAYFNIFLADHIYGTDGGVASGLLYFVHYRHTNPVLNTPAAQFMLPRKSDLDSTNTTQISTPITKKQIYIIVKNCVKKLESR